MKYVLVALETSGEAPSKGARVTEVAAQEVISGAAGRLVHLRISDDSTNVSSVKFETAMSVLNDLIGEGVIVVHDSGQLMRFVRAECRRAGISNPWRRGHQLIDTWAIAKERFPRQRHDLASLTRKAGHPAAGKAESLAEKLTNLLQVAKWLAVISNIGDPKVIQAVVAKDVGESPSSSPSSTMGEATAPVPEAAVAVELSTMAPDSTPRRSLLERLALCWQVLVGQA